MTQTSNASLVSPTRHRAVSYLVLIVFAILLVRTAWISQYAYINFRIVENFSHGYGLTFNVGERSLPISQPLWPFLVGIVYSITNAAINLSSINPLYAITILLQIGFSLLALSILIRLSGSRSFSLIVAVMFLSLSKTFIDYSTSGLENPLIHLLLGIFFVAVKQLESSENSKRKRDLAFLFIAGSSVVAVQWQWIALVSPILIAAGLRIENRPYMRFALMISVVPLLAYFIFSYISVGSIVPLQILARIRAGVGAGRLVRQGSMYLLNLLDFDPVSIVAIGFAFLGTLGLRMKLMYPVLGGLLLTGALIIVLGGDSLGGRYFSPIVFTSAFLILQLDIQKSSTASVALIMVFVMGVFSARSPWRSDATYSYPVADQRGILDGRGVDYAETGLLNINRDSYYPPGSDWAGEDWIFSGYKGVEFLGELEFGFRAYALGPNIYAATSTGLIDPLLSRLSVEDRVNWDLYSLERQVPDGYPDAVIHGPELLASPLSDTYTDLQQLTRAPFLSSEHLTALWSVFSEAFRAQGSPSPN